MAQNGNVVHELNYVLPNRFYVEIDSELTASFMQCSGIGFTMKKNSYAEGGVNEQERIYLGPVTYSDVTLQRGITDSLTFWEWAYGSLDPATPTKRRNINIVLFNQAGETMQCWTLIGAVVTGFKGPQLMANLPAQNATAAIEQVIVSYEGLRIQRSGGGGAMMNLTRDASGYFGSN
ncbi:phage tail protein [Gloeobacter violaceus]|uniref:Gll0428 protein n=1 Tax=Gloeobacter violaceus (strain ATCC 29082 / PCC 7421) TaxID=251221 RepID=Q7NNI3_GLOVI|nr:phage tail protein [Gloeobacter violaceus]BAC88369.1 gll0428 [Gloeobacter violaceus PCC 7421]